VTAWSLQTPDRCRLTALPASVTKMKRRPVFVVLLSALGISATCPAVFYAIAHRALSKHYNPLDFHSFPDVHAPVVRTCGCSPFL
jgi:hypothetical protein